MTNLIRATFAISLTSFLAACSSSPSDLGVPGGANGLGGLSSGGASKGGSPSTGNGGSQSGGAASGGTSSQGGAPASGGQAPGGTSSGGSSQAGASFTGGQASGGTSGGSSFTGGAGGSVGGTTSSRGGAPSGGAGDGGGGSSSGGRANSGGGTSMGGGAGSGGGSGGAGGSGGGTTCPLPSTFKWTSGGPAALPSSGWDSIKDFTYSPHNGKHVIYMSMHSGSSYGAAMMSFTDWPQAASATQSKLSFAAVAPTLFYFSPKQTWVLAYQWGGTGFSYRTSSDPTNPGGWSSEKSLYGSKTVPEGQSNTGVIDQTVICDAAKCYLFFNGDNGYIYRSSMPIGNFPGEFPPATTLMKDTPQRIFEAVQVYSVKGSNKYLMIVEAQGNGRYFRAWTATDLGGSWTLLTDNFAGKSNTTFSQNWTNDISHGDLVRSGADETFPIDPCNLQMIFQGRDPNSTAAYDKLPYRLGLLTAAK